MGHREDLLAGAKRCLYEKGYAQTTARDIVAASGTNLASIGYHYGSKEALLTAALVDMVNDFATEFDQLRAAEPATEPGSLKRFTQVWQGMIEAGRRDPRIWLTQFELLVQIDRSPTLREQVAALQPLARRGLASNFIDLSTLDDKSAMAVGAIYHALLLGVMAQWLISPESAPSAGDHADGLRIIADRLS
jgi:AcrR family transcriptional regulator